MFKGITTGQDTTCPHNLNFWIQALIKGMDISKGSWFDILSTNPTKAVLRTNYYGFIFNVETIPYGIDTIDKLKRVFVKDCCCLIKMNDVKLRG